LSKPDFKLKEQIHQHILKNPNIWTSEILDSFPQYDSIDILIALEELEREGKIR